MRKWMRKLWNDERGNALIIAVGAMPMVIGSAGLATDTVQWALLKRELQRAADSSALAGAYARYQNQDITTAVTNDLDQSNQTGLDLDNAPVIDTTIADSTAQSHKVKVTLSVSKRLPFSSFFTGRTQTIEAVATAAAVDEGKYCVVALEKFDTDITIQGSVNVNLGCGAFANSAYDPYDINGGGGASSDSMTFIASPIAAAGEVEDSTIWGDSVIQEYRMPQNDPFEGLDTEIPAGMTCSNISYTYVLNATNNTYEATINPGCYNAGQNNFDLKSKRIGNTEYPSTIVMNPGVYYLKNGDFKVSGQVKIVGTGVTIILTGDSGSVGRLDISGQADLTLTAPTTGTWANMLFVQSPLAADSPAGQQTSIVTGNSNSQFDGAIYFPATEVKVSGNNSGLTNCAMIVSQTVTFAGNATITNNPLSCATDHDIALKVIRLIG